MSVRNLLLLLKYILIMAMLLFVGICLPLLVVYLWLLAFHRECYQFQILQLADPDGAAGKLVAILNQVIS